MMAAAVTEELVKDSEFGVINFSKGPRPAIDTTYHA